MFYIFDLDKYIYVGNAVFFFFESLCNQCLVFYSNLVVTLQIKFRVDKIFGAVSSCMAFSRIKLPPLCEHCCGRSKNKFCKKKQFIAIPEF